MLWQGQLAVHPAASHATHGASLYAMLGGNNSSPLLAASAFLWPSRWLYLFCEEASAALGANGSMAFGWRRSPGNSQKMNGNRCWVGVQSRIYGTAGIHKKSLLMHAMLLGSGEPEPGSMAP